MYAAPLKFPKQVLHHLQRVGTRTGWLADDAPMIVAVSGGGDSVALLFLLLSLVPRERLIVAHFEHGIRGETSRSDAMYVGSLADSCGIPCHIEHGYVPESRRVGEGIEAAGRRLRYEFLLRVAALRGARWVCTGHTADDVAETALFHLFRGTGLQGLAGIPEQREVSPNVRLVRPLLRLGLRREELRAMLAAQGVVWREDGTNEDTAFSRNCIRLKLMPLVEGEINVRAREHIAELAEEAANRGAEERRKARSLLPWVRVSFPGMSRTWRQEKARGLSSQTLRLVIREEGALAGLPCLTREKLENLETLIRGSSSWRFQWSGDFEVFAGGGLLGWGRRGILRSEGPCEVRDVPFKTIWREWRIRGRLTAVNAAEIATTTRFRCPLARGETLSIMALAASSASVPGIPWWARGFWPVVCRDATPLWTPHPAGGSVLLPSDSERIRDKMLELSLEPREEGSVTGCSTNSGES